jgi:hypothetical protein
MSKLLFHEGEYDGIVLNKVIDGLKGVTLIRAAGKYGLGAFMQGFETSANRGVVAPDRLMAFRDRDFDFPVPDNESLIVPNQANQCVSYRTTIENYLLAPETLAAFNQEKKLGISQLVDSAEAKALLDEVANDITGYSGVRHALGATRKPTRLETTWTGGSGNLPADLTHDHCKEKATKMIETFQEEVQTVSALTFDVHLDVFLQQFSEEAFIQQRKYLIYFHGKDLMKRLSQQLGNAFPVKLYYRYALDHFDYKQFPDLVQLRVWIER